MTIEYQYIDETTWNPYPEGGIDNPRISFIVRVTIDGREKTRLVAVCGDFYLPFITFEVVDTPEERTYTPKISGIPEEEIESILWSITHDGVSVGDFGGSDIGSSDIGGSDFMGFDAEGVDVVCATAIITLKCGCDEIAVEESCYQFTGDQVICPDEIGLDLILEDGCWKPVRTGEIQCCVALDLILYRLTESEDWSILRDPYETICGNIVYFKRVVTFRGDVCGTMVFEINTDES